MSSRLMREGNIQQNVEAENSQHLARDQPFGKLPPKYGASTTQEGTCAPTFATVTLPTLKVIIFY